ncbi:MAG: RrF2 family transcriptional regulator [Bacillota bacterium]
MDQLIRRETDYALRALVYMATRPSGTRVTSADLAAAEDVPPDFLQKLLRKCARAGLLKAHRGAQGGFSLARAPREITVLHVVEAVQGPVTFSKCLLGRDTCPRSSACPLRGRWEALGEEVSRFMMGTTLEDLAKEVRQLQHKE